MVDTCRSKFRLLLLFCLSQSHILFHCHDYCHGEAPFSRLSVSLISSIPLISFSDPHEHNTQPHPYGQKYLPRSVRLPAREVARNACRASPFSQIFRTLRAGREDVCWNEVSIHPHISLFYTALSLCEIWLMMVSFAWAEILMCTAMLFRRFEFELCGVDRKRDVDVKRDCFLGQPSRENRGYRVKVSLRAD